MNKKMIYMVHPFVSRQIGAAPLVQATLEKELPNWKIINPFDSDLTEVWMAHPNDKSVAKQLVRKDFELIQNSQLVFAYLPDMNAMDKCGVAIGTCMEIFYTRHVLNKPVYALTPFCHPWLVALNVKTGQDIFELIKMIKEENP